MPSFTFVLIPGAGGSAWYWHLVAPKLEERGHEAVPVELRRRMIGPVFRSMLQPLCARLAIGILRSSAA
jgi:hypothetical protein